MKKRMLSLLIALCMALSLMPVTAFADDVEATHVTVKTAEELISAVEAATDGTVISVEGTIEVSQTLYVKSSVIFTGGGVIKAADDFAAKSNNVTDSNLMNLEVADKTLTLGDVTLDANGKAIALYCNKGKVVVDGAAITGGYSGTYVSGVYMTAGSQFEMNSGSITGNNSPYTNDGYMQYAADLWIGANATGAMTAINGGTIGNIFVNSNEWSAKNPGGFTLTNGNVTNLYVEYDAGFGGAFTYEGGTIENLYISTVNGNGDSVKIENPKAGVYKGGIVAQVGDTAYYTLKEAVDAVDETNDTVTVLSDVTLENALVVPAGKTVTLDLNGKTITGKVASNGALTIVDSTADKEPVVSNDYNTVTYESGKIISARTAVQAQLGGTITVKSGTIESTGNIGICALGDYTGEKDIASTVNVEGGYIISQESAAGVMGHGAVLNINGGVLVARDNAAVAGNGNHEAGNMLGSVEINITGGTMISHIQTPGYTACGVYLPGGRSLNISGGTIYAENGSGVCVRAGVANITGGEIIATGSEDGWVGDSKNIIGSGITYDKLANYPYSTENDVINISGNVKISGSLNILKSADSADTPKYISISGGYFTEDPSEYCVEGKTGVASDDANYPYTVGAKNDEAKPAEVEAVRVSADAAKGASEAAKNAAAAMDGAHVEQNNNLEAAVKNEANNNDIAVEDVLDELKAAVPTATEENTVIVYQPYIDVKVADAKTDGADTPKYTELTVEMTPMYRVIATTKDVYENEDATYYTDNTDKEHAQNAIIVEEAKELDLADKEYDVTVFLPVGFAEDNDKLSVKHEKDDGSVEYYTGTYRETTSATAFTAFTAFVQFTTKGFSPFTISAASESAAEVDGVIYPSLQAAVDAVKNNGTIKLLKNVAADEKATVSKTITFNVDPDNHAFDSKKNLVAGNRTTVTSEKLPNDVYSFKFTYTPSSGSGSTSSYYTVTVASTKNGTVSASTKSAAKDEVVTVTVKADNGYELDKLTITDANGNELKLTDKGDGKYTFVMPKSKVTVTATFAPADENTIFDDIDKDAYYYDAIKWAVANGVTNGMSTTEFVPDGPCTRGQIVTFLWRAAGKPAPTTTNNPFVDVNEKDYYYEAVLWAVENGITNGMSETEFMPELTCTRAHGVTFLYRAMGKAVDAKAEFSDVPADAYYAQAVAWAAANGVTNGVSEELFAPDNACTRVQIVTFLYRANLIK